MTPTGLRVLCPFLFPAQSAIVLPMEIDAALRKARQDRDAAVAERDRLDSEIAELELMIRGLELALARVDSTSGRPSQDAARSAWTDLPRTDAVIRALEEIGQPAGPADVTKVLRSHGRDDERDLVSASIAYLKTQKRVHSPGYGRWALGPAPDEESEPDEGGPS